MRVELCKYLPTYYAIMINEHDCVWYEFTDMLQAYLIDLLIIELLNVPSRLTSQDIVDSQDRLLTVGLTYYIVL